jgi:hypothetical protein
MLRKRITYANVASTLALVMVMTGGAWAVATLPRNSVGTPQLKDNAVKTAKVDNGSLLLKDLKAGQVDRPNATRWASHRDAGGGLQLVAKLPGLELRSECPTTAQGGPGPEDDGLIPYVQFKATANDVNYTSEHGSDVDMEAGQVIGAFYWFNASTVEGAQSGPLRQSFTAVLPNGTTVVGDIIGVANRGFRDCSFYGRLETYGG